jgi:PhnB protein
MQMQPYLFFEGRCEEAAKFYRNNLGAEVVSMMRFKDSPEPPAANSPTADPNKIMHMALRIGDTTLMASDGNCTGKPDFKGFSLAISAKTVAETERIFNSLAAGGQVRMPLTQTFFSPRFGMLADRFGLGWMILTEAAQPAAK